MWVFALLLAAGCAPTRVGGPGEVTRTPTPAIEASGTLLLQPGGTPYVSIRVQRAGRTPTPIANATVIVNGTPVPYVSALARYEAAYTGSQATGAAVSLSLDVPGELATGGTASVPPAVPAISSPVFGSVFGERTPIPVRWSTPLPGARYLAVDGTAWWKCAASRRGLNAPFAILPPGAGETTLPPFSFCVPIATPGISPTPSAAIYVATASGAPIPGTGQADPTGKLLGIADQWVVIRVGALAVVPITIIP